MCEQSSRKMHLENNIIRIKDDSRGIKLNYKETAYLLFCFTGNLSSIRELCLRLSSNRIWRKNTGMVRRRIRYNRARTLILRYNFHSTPHGRISLRNFSCKLGGRISIRIFPRKLVDQSYHRAYGRITSRNEKKAARFVSYFARKRRTTLSQTFRRRFRMPANKFTRLLARQANIAARISAPKRYSRTD